MVNHECNIVRDLLPLYAEDMVSSETAEFVRRHLSACPACQSELDRLQEGECLAMIETTMPAAGDAQPFRAVMKRLNRQFDSLAYLLIIFLIFLGFSWTDGSNLMYNSLIMPVVGVFGYYVFRWKAVYKVPVLLLIIDLLLCVFRLVELDLYAAFLWTCIYSIFVLAGIAVAFLLHFAFRKEREP